MKAGFPKFVSLVIYVERSAHEFCPGWDNFARNYERNSQVTKIGLPKERFSNSVPANEIIDLL